MRRRDDDLVRLADRVAGMPHVSPIIRGGIGFWLLLRAARREQALGWVEEAFAAHPQQPTGYHMGRMCAHLLARDAEGLARTLSEFGHEDGWVRPLMEGVLAGWRGDRAAAFDCLQRLRSVDPTIPTHGLGRACFIWHDDYLRVIRDAYGQAGLRLPDPEALP